MQLQTPVYARNVLNQHIVLSSDPKGTDMIEWSAAGDSSGNDVQIVSPEVANRAPFQRLLNRGMVVLSEENDDEVLAAFDAQRASWEARTSRTSQVAQASIERTQVNDTIAVLCAGPNARGVAGACGVDVAVLEKTKNEKPPLCAQHKNLASKFIPEQQQVPGSAEVKTVWLMPQLTARETA